MANYNDDYKERTAKGANVAETACVEFLNEQKNFHWYKMGFDEADRNIPFEYFVKIPEILRNIPDYVCIKRKAFFLECKGYRDYLKIKEADLKGSSSWNHMMDLYILAYDCVDLEHPDLSYTISADEKFILDNS